MEPIAQAVMTHFAQEGIRYTQPDGPSLFLAPFKLSSGHALLVCTCREEAQQLIASVLFPFAAPSPARPAVAELITRVNYGLSVGAFRMDYADGELSFRAGIDVEGDRLTPALVRTLVGCALATADHFYIALAAVALEGVPPLQALELIDLRPHGAQALAALRGAAGLAAGAAERRH